MEVATRDYDHLAVRWMTVQDREAAVMQAVSQGRWQRAVVLVQHGVTTSQRDTTLLRAAESKQWGCVLDVLRLGVSSKARAAVFLGAAEHQRWDCVSDVLHLGVSQPLRDKVFWRAVKNERWDCAGKLFDLGMSLVERDCMFSRIVDGGDARLTSELITAGVSPALQDQVLRGAVEKGRVAFLVELLRLTALTSVRTFVLDTAVSLRDWTLVFEAVKLHKELQLSAQQMDAVCRAAVSDRQWDCALFLLERCVELTQEMVDAVLRSGSGVLERLLGIFPRETLPSAVKRMLIEGAIGLDSADILQELLRRYGASKKETMQAFERTVSCRNAEALRVLVSCANRNSQLLKQFCATKSDVYPPQDITWICLAVKGRNIVLSLDIGLAFDDLVFADILLHNETSRKVRRMFLQKICTDKESLFEKIADQLIVRYPNYRRTLFLMAVRQGYHSLASKLYGTGVSVSDVRYALRVSFAHNALKISFAHNTHRISFAHEPDSAIDDLRVRVWGFIGKLNREDCSTLLKGFVRESVDSFVSTGRERKFLEWFTLYCEWKEAEARFVDNVFRRAYKTAVEREQVYCFVKIVSLVTRFICSKSVLDDVSDQEYTSTAVAAIGFAVKKQKFRFVSQIILTSEVSGFYGVVLNRLFRKGVSPVFDLLFDFENLSEDPHDEFSFSKFFWLMNGYMDEFKHCLFQTVDKASETLTAGISDTLTPVATEKVSVGASDTLSPGISDILTAVDSDTPTSRATEKVAVFVRTPAGVSDTLTSGATDKVTVGASDTLTSGATDKVTVGASDTLTAGAFDILTARASDTLTLGATDTLTAGASDTQTPGATEKVTAWASDLLTAGASDTLTLGATDTLTVTPGVTGKVTVGATCTVNVEAVRVLDKWLHCLCPGRVPYARWEGRKVLTGELGRYLRDGQRSAAVLRLAEFSSGQGCHSLALFLATALGPDGRELMKRTVASHLHAVGHNLLYDLADYALRSLGSPALFAFLIKNISMSVLISEIDIECITGYFCPSDRARSQKVIAALRRRKAYPWVLVCQVVVGDFVETEKTLTLCGSQESDCVDVVLTFALKCSRWDLVSKYVSEACRPDLLRELLNSVLDSQSTADVSLVRRLVNLVGTSRQVYRYEPPLRRVVFGVPLDKRLRALGIARCLVSLGVSAQHQKEEYWWDISRCPLREVSVCRELQLVKLFHRSGVCPNYGLFDVASESHDPGFFRDENSDVTKEAIQGYLTFAASCPLSLQDLCRHTVSECLGGQPGYLRRVQALPVPELVKEFVLFSDLVQEESGGQTGE